MLSEPIARALIVGLALGLASIGCSRDRIDVIANETGESGDFGLAKLEAAVDEYVASSRSPIAFRKLHETIESLRPKFNAPVALLAERYVVFLALDALESVTNQSYPDQAQDLALTVWPTAFRVEPESHEIPMQYLERICGGPLASECKHVIPEFWPIKLNALAWRRLRSRAREAYVRCRRCRNDETFQRSLERYEERVTAVVADYAAERHRFGPEHWPRAGKHATPWEEAPLLALERRGEAVFEGVRLEEDSWRQVIRDERNGRSVLSVHLNPTARVRTLRGVVRDAGSSGYEQVSLIARAPSFPYQRREYRLTTGHHGGIVVDARDEDSIQVLVQALDVAAGRAAATPGRKAPVLRLE